MQLDNFRGSLGVTRMHSGVSTTAADPLESGFDRLIHYAVSGLALLSLAGVGAGFNPVLQQVFLPGIIVAAAPGD